MPACRAAQNRDLPLLLELERQTFDGDRLSARQLRHHLDSPSAELRVIPGESGGIDAYALWFYRRGSRRARLYSLAVAAHEIPQEVGDFAILLAAGHSRSRALLLNLSSATAGLAGAGMMLLFGSQAPGVLPFVLAFAAGSFLYVAMADLIPHLHRGAIDSNAVRQTVLIALGVGLVPFVLATPHHAPAAVVAQVDQALMTAPETADGGDTQALGQSPDRTTRSTGAHARGPKLPPSQ